MHDAAQAGGAPMLLQNLKEIVPGARSAFHHVVFGPAMDQDGPLAGGGNLQLANQALALYRVRRAFVVVVQADLAAGDHLRLGQQAVQLVEHRAAGLAGVVRIDAGAGVKPGNAGPACWQCVELPADVERPVHSIRLFADADGQHRAHARLPRTAQHGGAVVRVAFTVQVGMRLD